MFAIGDMAILLALFTYMYLQTGMLVTVLKRHRNSLLRRLRWLETNGFVVSLKRPHMDNTFALGHRGWEYVATEMGTTQEKLPFSKKASRINGVFLQHSLQLVKFWIDLETATQEQDSRIALHKCLPEWTLDDPTSKDVTKRFLLWERFSDPKSESEKLYSFRPDGAFLVYNRSVGISQMALLLCEIDRCTEAVSSRIRDKFYGIKLAFENGIYRKYDAGLMRVFFIIDGGKRRIKTMQHQLQLMAENLGDPNPADPAKEKPTPASFVHLFRFGLLQDINPQSIVTSPLWLGWKGDARYALFSAGNKSPENSNG